VPLLARAMDTLSGGSLVGLRLPATLLSVFGVVAAALIARELGGRTRAQVLAAGAYAFSADLIVNRVLSIATVDCFLWMLVTWLLVLRPAAGRLWSHCLRRRG
jgi:hypothetical protein